jgi:hypothetical protein
MKSMSLAQVSPKEIHPDLREALEGVMRDLTRVKRDGGSVAATIKNMRKKKASDIAERIFDLYNDLHELVRPRPAT